MRIIGSKVEQIPGQTLLWLIARASEVNQFDGLDVKKLFAAVPSQGFNTKAKANPGVLDGFNVSSLLKLLNVSYKYLRYSCLEFYLPSHGYSSYSSYEECIRICPICARQGLHLTFHQISFWKMCLLHKTRLISTCVKCGSSLGMFSLKECIRGELFNPYKCQNCGYIQIKIEVSYKNKRKKTLLEQLCDYEAWLHNVRRAYNKTIPFYDQTPQIQTVHGSNFLVSRPGWVDDCLLVQPRSNVYIRKLDKDYELKRVRNNGDIELCTLNICADIVLNYADVYKSFIRDLFCISEEILNESIQKRTSSFRPWKTDGYSIWAEAYFYLENYIKSYRIELENNSDSIFTTEQTYWLIKPDLLSSWLNGPVRATKHISTEKDKQLALLLMLSKFWVWNHLYAQYCNYLKNIITQDLSRYWFYKYSDLDRSMSWTDDTNTYLFHMDSQTAVLEVFSPNLPINQLINVYNNGFITTYGFEKSKTIREQIKRITACIIFEKASLSIVKSALEYRTRM